MAETGKFVIITIDIIINPLTARVAGAPQTTSQAVSLYGESWARFNPTEPIPLQVEHVAVEFIVEVCKFVINSCNNRKPMEEGKGKRNMAISRRLYDKPSWARFEFFGDLPSDSLKVR